MQKTITNGSSVRNSIWFRGLLQSFRHHREKVAHVESREAVASPGDDANGGLEPHYSNPKFAEVFGLRPFEPGWRR